MRPGGGEQVRDYRLIVIGDLDEHHCFAGECDNLRTFRPHPDEAAVQSVPGFAVAGFVLLAALAALPVYILLVVGPRDDFQAGQDNPAVFENV